MLTLDITKYLASLRENTYHKILLAAILICVKVLYANHVDGVLFAHVQLTYNNMPSNCDYKLIKTPTHVCLSFAMVNLGTISDLNTPLQRLHLDKRYMN